MELNCVILVDIVQRLQKFIVLAVEKNTVQERQVKMQVEVDYKIKKGYSTRKILQTLLI